jgi:subtilase family serine protease
MPSSNALWCLIFAALLIENHAQANRWYDAKPVCIPQQPEGTMEARCFAQMLVDADGTPITTAEQIQTLPPGYTPTQVKHAYGLDLLPHGNTGAGKTIAIIEAFDAPNIASDLATFKAQFGISGCSLTKINQNGQISPLPAVNPSWALETSLDVEWACAIAPGAKIILVEASSANLTDLLTAVTAGVNAGANIVSMSWGIPEIAGELAFDVYFLLNNVTFIAASGDSGTGTSYPAASPRILSVGGTTLLLDSTGNLTSAETAWAGSSGGFSQFELIPTYQIPFLPPLTLKRGVPDVAFNANPTTGVLVYDSTPISGASGWFGVGGTSLGAPAWAGIIALADQARAAGLFIPGNLLSSPFYNAAASTLYTVDYRDITSGFNGGCGAICTAHTGYDLVTGLGSPHANKLVPFLQTH